MFIGRIIVLIFTLDIVFPSPTNYILPNNVIPLNYKIHFDHSDFNDYQNKYFSGKVSIDVEVLESTRNMRLHKRYMKITSCNLKKLNFSTIYKLQSQNFNETTDQLDLRFDQVLDKGYYTLNVDYVGEYNETYGILRRSDQKFYRKNW